MTTYLLAGGGTAGHVNPLLAVADLIRSQDPTALVFVLGTAEGLEARLVPERGYPLLVVPKIVFPRRPSAAVLRFPGAFSSSVRRIRSLIRQHRVDVVVGFGGYVSAPAYVAARREKKPIVVHEANARPGIANRLGARFTQRVGIAFRQTRLPHATFVGMPLRREIVSMDRAATRAEAIRHFGLDPRKPVLLVTGGSQGAMAINDTVWESASLILGTGWQLLHITGARWDRLDPELAGYALMRYCDRMELAIAAADLALARGGAATVSEFSALGVPAVYVPLPIGNGEQALNAQDQVEAGGALIVDNAQFTPDWVASTLVALLGDRALVADMAARARSVGVLDGAERVVAMIGQALAGSTPAGTARARPVHWLR